MLSISNPDLTDKIYWCLFYDPLNIIWAHIHVLFMAMKTYFHDPWNSSLVRVRFQITWPWNLMIRVSWHIKVNFGYSWIFLPWKPADFHDPLISGLDHHQLCMAIKTFFMSHEIIFMKIKWVSMRLWILENAIFMPLAWKKDSWVFHLYFMGFLWNCIW